jgi:antitoxin component YwqK of YwqJK toxin-antitoxin module
MYITVFKTSAFKQIVRIACLSCILLIFGFQLYAQECGAVRSEKTGRVLEIGECNGLGQRHGEWTFYYDNNLKDEIRLKAKGSYHLGKKSGTWTYYDTYGPYVLKEATYVFDRLNGPYKDYYDTGHKDRWIKSKGEYKSGKREGQWIDYWDNGCYGLEGPPKEIAIYKAGIRHGESATYYDSNCYPEKAMASRGYYDHGKKDGEWKHYNDKGNEDANLIKKFNFDKGRMVGKHYLYENGRTTRSFDYTQEPDDEGMPEFNEAGKLVKKVYPNFYLTFHEDSEDTPLLEMRIPTDEEGKPIGTWLYYYKSGALKKERSPGFSTDYYESGKVMATAPLSKKRNYNGVKKEYEETGELKSMALYSYGELRYTFLFHPNGKLKKAADQHNWEYWELYDDGSLKKYRKYRPHKRNIVKEYKKGKKKVTDPERWESVILEGMTENWGKTVSAFLKETWDYHSKH